MVRLGPSPHEKPEFPKQDREYFWKNLQKRQALHSLYFQKDHTTQKDQLTHAILRLAACNGNHWLAKQNADEKLLRDTAINAVIELVTIFNALNRPIVGYFHDTGAGDGMIIRIGMLCKLADEFGQLNGTLVGDIFDLSKSLLANWLWIFRVQNEKPTRSWLTSEGQTVLDPLSPSQERQLIFTFGRAYHKRLDDIEKTNINYAVLEPLLQKDVNGGYP